MGFMGMGQCADCGKFRLVSPNESICEQCLRDTLQRVVDVNPDSMREHPDLEEFDDYGDRWYR
jgi:hypothetical protein